MIWLLAASLAALVGLLVSSEWRHAETTRVLVEAVRGERADYIALVDRLCQRVQSPTQAVIEHSIQTVPPVDPPAATVTDEQWWMANGVPKERLADMVDQIELAG